jgi:exopolysaccharide production protein ExoZ
MRNRGKPNLDGLQILRGLAAASVVFHHVLEESHAQLQVPDWFTRAGAAGVDVFFVLSGFIMLYTIPTGPDRPSEARAFLVRRILRIAPLYWLIVILIALMHRSGLFYRSLVLTPVTFLRSLLFLERSHLVLGVAWTLNYEMYFYVLFACTICFTKSSRLTTLLVGSAIAINSALLAPLLSTDWKLFLANPIALEFVAGMALGLLHKKLSLRAIHRRWVVTLALAAVCVASEFGPATNTNGLVGWGRLVAWGGAAVALTLCSLYRTSNPATLTRSLVVMGDGSYAIYLYHPLLMVAYATLLLRVDFAVHTMVLLVILVTGTALLGGICIHFLVERPLIARIKQMRLISNASYAGSGTGTAENVFIPTV